jgi:S1-C subfamily serine protease
VNPVDLVAIALVVIALVLGFRSGALPQIGGLAGALAGGALALVALPFLEEPLATLEPTMRAFAVLIGLILAIGAGEAVGSGLGRAMASGLGTGVLGALDRAAGGLVGVGQALLIVWLAGGLLANGPLPRVAADAQTSVAVRALTAVLPAPTEFAAGLARVLDASGLPDVFVGLEPLPAPPVDRPDDPEARAIAEAALGSTVKVIAETCGRLSTGSGFAVADGYLVTNAHVVAGSGTVRVSVDGRVADAVPVHFDPQIDLALLWAPNIGAPPLRLASSDPQRGAGGAALGYPGGGALTVVSAAVADGYDARGRDIYGSDAVTRPVLELRTQVDRGNSGGPFVLVDGTVGGVVFAEARADEDIGYAIAATEVARRIAPAIGRTAPVDTSACIR